MTRQVLKAIFLVICAANAPATTDFALPEGPPDLPEGIAVGTDGNLWIANELGRTIARITTSGTITKFAVPNGVLPTFIVPGPDGNLWFTDAGGDFIGKLTTAGVFTEYPITAGAEVRGITVGPDGALWFAEHGRAAMGRMTTTGDYTEFPTAANTDPYQVATGADGNLWFTNFSYSKIGRVTPSGAVTLFDIPSGADAKAIVAGPDGNLWFGEGGVTKGDSIGKVTPGSTVSIAEFTTPSFRVTEDVGVGPDNQIWFREHNSRLGKIDPATQVFTEYNGFFVGRYGGLVTGPDGNLWSASSTSTIEKVAPDGALLNTYALNKGVEPWFIATGADGNVWFTELTGTNIGRLTPTGTLTEFSAHTNFPVKIARGPDGAMWYDDSFFTLFRMDPAGNVQQFQIDAPGLQQNNPACEIYGLTTGPDGNLWIADSGDCGGFFQPAIDIFHPGAGQLAAYNVSPDEPVNIVTGPDGNLWFTDELGGGVGRITSNGKLTNFSQIVPLPIGITNGPDGNLWFQAEDSQGTVGKITTSGIATLYRIGRTGFAEDIVAAPDGALWIPEDGMSPGNPQIAVVGTDGTLLDEVGTSYVGGEADGITVGSDHKLWVTLLDGGRISRLSAIHGKGLSIAGATGRNFSGEVATFVDGTPTAAPADFSATIDWGDGKTTPGTVSGPAGGPFQVSGSHIFQKAGNLILMITLHDTVDDEDYHTHGGAAVQAQAVPSTVMLVSDTNPAQAGQTATFTATVGSTVLATGTVEFDDFGASIGTMTLDGTATAKLVTSTLAAGPHEITATYLGDSLHSGSQSNVVDEIITTAGQAASGTVLTPSQITLTGRLDQRSVMLDAAVTGSGATGTVSFYAGQRLLGSQPLDNTGHAQITTSELDVSGNQLTAAYSGDANFAASISPLVVVYRSPKPH